MPRSKAYTCWANMVQRNRKTGYAKIEVCEEWHQSEVFLQWYAHNYREGFDLDKDLLVPGNRLYSPKTCMFIPSTLNRKLVGIRKCGVHYRKAQNGRTACWRAQGYDLAGRRRSLKQSHSREECLQVYRQNKNRFMQELAIEYPAYAELIINLKDYWSNQS